MVNRILYEVYTHEGKLVEVLHEAPDRTTRLGFELVGYSVKPVVMDTAYIKVGDKYVRVEKTK